VISVSKHFALLFLAILTASFIIVAKPVFAQIPTPSVPEFTVRPVGPSYTVNTTYSLDPDTGKIVAQIGYHAEYSAVEVSIKNQPYSPYYDANSGLTTVFCYNIRVEDHSQTNNWTVLYNPYTYYPTMSNSDYTNILIPVEGSQIALPVTPRNNVFIPTGACTDIQVEALIGVVTGHLVLPTNGGFPSVSYVFNGTESGWSDTQMITLPANTPLSPTSPPPVNSDPSTALIPIIIVLVVIALLISSVVSLVLFRRHHKKPNGKGQSLLL
jgi:hypothetical protein